jgi:1-acyl-sn-glycerol-3-phosphate acyltransferase
MREALDAGLPVVFFPEGTTSNGTGLLRFRSGLLAQVLAEGAKVTPAYLSYSLAEDNGPDITVAEDVCYWGDHQMLKHLFRLLGLRGIQAHLRFAESPMSFSNSGVDRKLAAREAREAVAALANPGGIKSCTISDSTNVHLA